MRSGALLRKNAGDLLSKTLKYIAAIANAIEDGIKKATTMGSTRVIYKVSV